MLSPSFRLQGPLTCAIGRWVDEAMPTYRTNDEARFHLRCNPAPLYQWVRKFQSCRSPLQLSPGWLSRITHYNESLESHREKVNLPESARKVLQTWRIRYSKGWGCISWCWSSFSWVVCRFALRQFSRKDLYINFLFIYSYYTEDCKEILPDSPPTSIFFKFFASRITTVNLPAVGTYLKEKQMSPNLLSCNRLR